MRAVSPDEFLTAVMQYSGRECGLIVDFELGVLAQYLMTETDLADLRQTDSEPLLRRILLDGFARGRPVQAVNYDYMSANEQMSGRALNCIMMVTFGDNALLWYGGGRCVTGVFRLPDVHEVADFLRQIEPKLILPQKTG
jgi:hypothetical protein